MRISQFDIVSNIAWRPCSMLRSVQIHRESEPGRLAFLLCFSVDFRRTAKVIASPMLAPIAAPKGANRKGSAPQPMQEHPDFDARDHISN